MISVDQQYVEVEEVNMRNNRQPQFSPFWCVQHLKIHAWTRLRSLKHTVMVGLISVMKRGRW